jgi:2-dehydro-3-deoxy-D-arabinonate dehydratase
VGASLIRYVGRDGIGIGLANTEAPALTVCRLNASSLGGLLELPLTEFRNTVAAADEPNATGVRLLPPIDGLTEVWAAGVTYFRSSQARQEESAVADVYARVYDARRPELFFKSTAWRVCGDGEPIGVRPDSEINVPEPELALVCNSAAELVGFTVCNDVSSRSIEGENPLYLPQAKIYSGSCAIGPGIVPVWEAPDPTALDITVTVLRDGAILWTAQTSTSQLHRQPDDLIEHLFRHATFPQGVILSTGTGLVPDFDVTLKPNDVAIVRIDGIGQLSNPVRTVTAESFAWLTPMPNREPA